MDTRGYDGVFLDNVGVRYPCDYGVGQETDLGQVDGGRHKLSLTCIDQVLPLKGTGTVRILFPV